jgi:hypothetical protein
MNLCLVSLASLPVSEWVRGFSTTNLWFGLILRAACRLVFSWFMRTSVELWVMLLREANGPEAGLAVLDAIALDDVSGYPTLLGSSRSPLTTVRENT